MRIIGLAAVLGGFLLACPGAAIAHNPALANTPAATGTGAATEVLSPLPQTSAQGELLLTINIVDDLTPRPVPLTDVRIVSASDPSATRTVRTDAQGRASVQLLPGAYTLHSVRPVRYRGRTLNWQTSFTITEGQTTTLSLTDADAAEQDRASSPDGETEQGSGEDRKPGQGGLARRFRLGIGKASNAYDTRGNSVGLAQFDVDIYLLKLDYSYFRPTRHEAMFSVWRAQVEDSRGVTIASTEYRWRFGGRGEAYFGIGLGRSFPSGGGEGATLSTGALGIHLGEAFYIESRSLYNPEFDIGLSGLMLGFRF